MSLKFLGMVQIRALTRYYFDLESSLILNRLQLLVNIYNLLIFLISFITKVVADEHQITRRGAKR